MAVRHARTTGRGLATARAVGGAWLLGLSLAALDAHAVTRYEWSGLGLTDNWTNPDNWQDGERPPKDLVEIRVVFNANAFALSEPNPDMNEDWSVAGLGFFSTDGNTEAYDIFSSSDSTLSVGAEGIFTSTHETLTLRMKIRLAAEQSWRTSRTLVVLGRRSGDFDLRINDFPPNTGGCKVPGCINGEGGGLVFLGGDGSQQTGDLVVHGGTLMFGDVDAVSSATTIRIVSNSAVVDLFNTTEAIGGLAGGGEMRIGLGLLQTGDANNALDEFTGALVGSGTFEKRGSGLMRLAGNNTAFTGLTKITAGTLEIAGDSDALNDAARVEVAAGARLVIGGNGETLGLLHGAGDVVLNADAIIGGNGGNAVLGGAISGSGRLEKTGAGSLRLDGTNSFAGGLRVTRGTVTLGSGDNLLDTATLEVGSNGQLAVEGDGEVVGGLRGAGIVALKHSLTLGLGNQDDTFSGNLSGDGGLTKAGLGTQTLNGRNAFRGPLRVAAGTLEVGGSGDNLGNDTPVEVDQGAMLRIAGDGEDLATLTGRGRVRADAALGIGSDVADGSFAGRLEGAGRVTKLGRRTLALTGASDLAGDLRVRAGTLALTGDEAKLVVQGALSVQRDGRFELQDGLLDAARITLLGGAFAFTGGQLQVDRFEGTLTNLGGTLAPGHSPGTTTIVGDYVQGADATLAIEFGSAEDFDVLRVEGGTATLGGRLVVQLVDDFDAALGREYEFLVADGGIIGAFASVVLPAWQDKTFQLRAPDAQRLVLQVVTRAGGTPAPVPLPPSGAALASGLTLLALAMRRRRRA